jgi:hypothetical protein
MSLYFSSGDPFATIKGRVLGRNTNRVQPRGTHGSNAGVGCQQLNLLTLDIVKHYVAQLELA